MGHRGSCFDLCYQVFCLCFLFQLSSWSLFSYYYYWKICPMLLCVLFGQIMVSYCYKISHSVHLPPLFIHFFSDEHLMIFNFLLQTKLRHHLSSYVKHHFYTFVLLYNSSSNTPTWNTKILAHKVCVSLMWPRWWHLSTYPQDVDSCTPPTMCIVQLSDFAWLMDLSFFIVWICILWYLRSLSLFS